MVDKGMLLPAAVLVLWSMIVLIWMFIDRGKKFAANKVDVANAPPGTRGPELAKGLPDWAAHNYMHLMEQPTVFYAACIILAMAGATGYDKGLAWAYVLLRVVHSVWQIKVNTVPVRAGIFALFSLAMLLLAVRAVLATLD